MNRKIRNIKVNFSENHFSILFWFFFSLMLVISFAFLFVRGEFGYQNAYDQVRKIKGICIISVFIFIFLNSRYLKHMTRLSWVIILWTYWAFLSCLVLIQEGVRFFSVNLMEAIYCPLIFLGFYIYTKTRPSFHISLANVFVLISILSSFFFFRVFQYRMASLSGDHFKQLYDVYYVLLLLPWVLLSPKPFLKYAGIIIMAAVVFLSFKRTAILAFAIALILYYVGKSYISHQKISLKRLIGWGFFISIMMFLILEINNQTNGFLFHRMDTAVSSGGSGRLEIYEKVIEAQMSSDFIPFFIGHGYAGVRRDHVTMPVYYINSNGRAATVYHSAHNDWLEALYDYGVIGFILYIYFHVLIIRYTWHLLIQRSYFAPALLASYSLFFIISLTSHLAFYTVFYSYLTAFWGCVFALTTRREMANHRKIYPKATGAHPREVISYN